ncbi:hypothetical protein N8203_04220 [Crocinitomicaceae bacterium]|nr:hypothetical protein [Crocinitomicaceae bacterium]
MKLILTIFILFISIWSFGQNYATAIGIKGGYPGYGTINAKHFISTNTALEASLGGFTNEGGTGAFVMLNYEINSALESGFSWYYGGGGLIGFTNHVDDRPSLNIGINGVLGIEYTFEEVPINCSLDTGPFIFFEPNVRFAWGGGLALRYAIR